MPERNAFAETIQSNYWYRVAGLAVLALLALYLFVLVISEFKAMRYIGSGVSASNTITVSGEGEVTAVPDTATFSVTIQERASTVKAAQELATKKTNDIVAYLKDQDIDEKDVQTSDYSVYPEYDYETKACAPGEYCVPGKQVLRGYQVSQTLTVKVRDTEQAGDLLTGVGERGATQVSGLSFTIDDEEALKASARDEAIAQAKDKADELARALGVNVVRVVGFSENDFYPPMPYAYGRGGATMDMAVAQEAKAAPEIPTGENKIISNVTITYEIR
ncbi:MAG: SIMPL domain-containing protein [Minisyncoccota bacterium]|jgi:hypothetical protein